MSEQDVDVGLGPQMPVLSWHKEELPDAVVLEPDRGTSMSEVYTMNRLRARRETEYVSLLYEMYHRLRELEGRGELRGITRRMEKLGLVTETMASDEVSTRKRRRVADPLREYVRDAKADDLADGTWRKACLDMADAIDRDHDVRMEQCRRETKRAAARYINSVVVDYLRHDMKRSRTDMLARYEKKRERHGRARS